LHFPVANLLLVRLRDVEPCDHLHGLADIARSALRTERRVRGKEYVIGAEEFEPANRSDATAAQRRIGVKVPKAIHQRLPQHLEHAAIAFIRAAAQPVSRGASKNGIIAPRWWMRIFRSGSRVVTPEKISRAMVQLVS